MPADESSIFSVEVKFDVAILGLAEPGVIGIVGPRTVLARLAGQRPYVAYLISRRRDHRMISARDQHRVTVADQHGFVERVGNIGFRVEAHEPEALLGMRSEEHTSEL